MLWSLNARPVGAAWAWVALGACGLGTLLMSAAAFVDPGTPVMANYIPMLDSASFRAGLLVFAAGTVVLVLRSLFAAPRVGQAPGGADALRFGINASVVAAAVALLAFGWSWAVVPADLPARAYYEILYWGGGHALWAGWCWRRPAVPACG